MIAAVKTSYKPHKTTRPDFGLPDEDSLFRVPHWMHDSSHVGIGEKVIDDTLQAATARYVTAAQNHPLAPTTLTRTVGWETNAGRPRSSQSVRVQRLVEPTRPQSAVMLSSSPRRSQPIQLVSQAATVKPAAWAGAASALATPLAVRIPGKPNSARSYFPPTAIQSPPRFASGSAPEHERQLLSGAMGIATKAGPGAADATESPAPVHTTPRKLQLDSTGYRKLLYQRQQPPGLGRSALMKLPSPLEGLKPVHSDNFELFSTLRRAPLLRYLDDIQLSELVRLGRRKFYPRYSILLREGTIGTQLVVLLSGQVHALATSYGASAHPTSTQPTTHERGACFGAPGLVVGMSHDNTVIALCPCEVLILERSCLFRQAPAGMHQQARLLEEASFDVHLRTPATGTQGVPTPLMQAIQLQREWTELRLFVFVRLLENVPFFSSLDRARREAVAELLDLEIHDAGAVLFRENDIGGQFYLNFSGLVEIVKISGRDASGSSRYTTIAQVTHSTSRPWFGEMAIWLNKPRQGTAVVGEGGARLLTISSACFETFVALCPDFRTFINKSQSQVVAYASANPEGVTREQSAREEKAAITQVSIGVAWKSDGVLGGLGQEVDGERCFFAERWERMVAEMLFRLDEYTRQASTVSLNVKDYPPLDDSPVLSDLPPSDDWQLSIARTSLWSEVIAGDWRLPEAWRVPPNLTSISSRGERQRASVVQEEPGKQARGMRLGLERSPLISPRGDR